MIKSLISEHKKLVDKTIDYFLCEVLDPVEFENIKNKAKEFPLNRNQDVYISSGYFSILDCILYLSRDFESVADGIVQSIVNLLVENNVLVGLSEGFGIVSNSRRYKANGNYALNLYKRGVIFNLIFGWNYIIENYSNSVLIIENIDNLEDVSNGTGFYLETNCNGKKNPFVITNKHVLEGHKILNIFDNNGNKVEYKKIHLDDKHDLAFITLNLELNTSSFQLNIAPEILAEIITIGYPSIPMSNNAYQICHKGEVNAIVEDHGKNKLIVFSAKTSSGNSGSPLIDKNGMVCGIVTNELFVKDELINKGKLPYYAAIPGNIIIEALNLMLNKN